MLTKKKVDSYLVAIILLVFAIDLIVFLCSPTPIIPVIWSIASLNVKGWICSWNHHHQHNKFCSHAWANRGLEFVMGLHTGIVGEAWVLHHTLGHHINYLDQTKDESAWQDGNGRLMSHLAYTLHVGFFAYPLALKVGKRYPKSRRKLVQNILLTLLFLSVFAWINWVHTLIIFLLPMLFLLFMTAYVTYHHHAGLDEQDPYQATYNITDRWYNFFTCNLGYHTAHHLHCGRHWSELPRLHEEIRDKIPSHLYQDPGFPFLLMTKVEKALSQKLKKMPSF